MKLDNSLIEESTERYKTLSDEVVSTVKEKINTEIQKPLLEQTLAELLPDNGLESLKKDIPVIDEKKIIETIKKIDKESTFTVDKKRQEEIVKQVTTENKSIVDRATYLNNYSIEDPLEKVRSLNGILPVYYLEKGYSVSKAVGCLRKDEEGIGTGFLITPTILITNHHVIGSREEAEAMQFVLNYELGYKRELKTVAKFSLNPNDVFITSPVKELDFTIVSVQPTSIDRLHKLEDFGYLKLIEDKGKVLQGDYLSIIHHPGGVPKKITIRNNQVSNLSLPNHIWYKTDTDHGSSGAPVFNDDWNVVALHHAGKPTLEAGQMKLTDGRLIDKNADVDETQIDWESNEGVRISALCKHLKEKDNALYEHIMSLAEYVPHEEQEYHRILEKNIPSIPQTTKQEPIKIPTMSTTNNMITVTLPLEIHIGVGALGVTAAQNTPVQNKQVAPVAAPELKPKTSTEDTTIFEKKTSLNKDYSSRKGFDEAFLEGIDISLSSIYEPQKKFIPKLKAGKLAVLEYTHFSVVMHGKRKLCMMTAVNIDGKSDVKIKRSGDHWILDSRLLDKYQTGPEVYEHNNLDRGHMVRREDPNWGDDATLANDDTFHYTNSTPQHKNLNQKIWLQLEDFILKNTNSRDLKVSVLTGPVFSVDDIDYRTVKLPLQYWKVAFLVKKSGELSVTGYVLSQESMMDDLEAVQDFDFGKSQPYQVSLKHIADITGLNFSDYYKNDPLNDALEGASTFVIHSTTDIKL